MATLPRLFRPTDPLYALQWQYGLIGRLGDLSRGSTAGIERVWADVTGAGVAVASGDLVFGATTRDRPPTVPLARPGLGSRLLNPPAARGATAIGCPF